MTQAILLWLWRESVGAEPLFLISPGLNSILNSPEGEERRDGRAAQYTDRRIAVVQKVYSR